MSDWESVSSVFEAVTSATTTTAMFDHDIHLSTTSETIQQIGNFISHCNKFIKIVNKFIHILAFLPHSRDLSSRNQLSAVKVINSLWFSSFFYYRKFITSLLRDRKKPFLHNHQLFTPRHCLNILHIDGLEGKRGMKNGETGWETNRKIIIRRHLHKNCSSSVVFGAVIQFGLWIMEISGESFGKYD